METTFLFHIDEECSQCHSFGLTVEMNSDRGEYLAYMCKPCIDELFKKAGETVRERDAIK
jgi:hypothetical protein